MEEAAFAEDEPRRWKFAISHIAQTLELLLKARLAREHELLVRANVDKSGRLTVGFDQALERLKNCGVAIDQEDLRRLRSARELRNDLVHFTTNATSAELKAAYIDLFEFAHVFHLKELNEELHDYVDPDLRDTEAVLMEAFRADMTTYQGAEIIPKFAAEIVAAQYETKLHIAGQAVDRIRYGNERRYDDEEGSFKAMPNCGDCAVRTGQLHVPGCDIEECPRCGRQLISCDCEWAYEDDKGESS